MPDPTTLTSAWELVGWLVGLQFFTIAALIAVVWFALREAQLDKKRMAGRVTALEDIATSVLREALVENNKAILQFTQAVLALEATLNKRSCLLMEDHQEHLLETISERIARVAKEKLDGGHRQ